MKLTPFKLERYFSKYEFSVNHLLSSSDCEPLNIHELLINADKESLNMWENLTLSYTESKGHPLLLDEISKLYNGINAENILEIVPEEGIYITMRTLLQKGDEVVCVNPCYQSLQEVAKAQGANIKLWEAKYKDGWHFSLDDLKKQVSSKTKMIVINFPHNPTGAFAAKAEFDEIINIAKENDCILFSDEMYRFLEYDENSRLPSVCEVYEKGISLCGMSKTFAMAGVRLGWLITKNAEYMKEFATYKDYTTICLPACSQVLSIMALRQSKYIVKRNLNIIAKNISFFEKFAEKHSKIIDFVSPIAGSVAMPIIDKNLNVYDMAQDLADKKSIMILPASVYDVDVNGFRLGLGRKDFAKGLNVFDEYLSNNI